MLFLLLAYYLFNLIYYNKEINRNIFDRFVINRRL